MKTTPFFAMHGHFGAGFGVLMLLMFLVAVLLVVLWPSKGETK